MNRLLVCLAIILASFSSTVAAHALEHHLTEGRGEAAVLSVHRADQQAFVDEAYRIFYETESRPVQTGRSDAGGRIVFRPERVGRYRIETATQDGHGGVYHVHLGTAGGLTLEPPPRAEHGALMLFGAIILFGGFAVVALSFGTRRPAEGLMHAASNPNVGMNAMRLPIPVT